MKRIAVAVAGSGRLHDLEIQPGTTASDILRELGLTGYQLAKIGGGPFGAEENIYPRVEDGEKLIAATPAEVGVGRVRVIGERPVRRPLFPFPFKGRSIKGEPILVKRDERPYWQEQGWERRDGRYKGWYRTRFKSFEGEITEGPNGLTFYIFNPPIEALHRTEHWPCFERRGRRRWRIHFRTSPRDLDSGILEVEQILEGALTLKM